MTPGERFKNWAEGSKVMISAIVVLVGALGYTNKDEIQGFIFTNDNTAITTLTPFEAHVRDEIERIDLESATAISKTDSRFDEIEAALKKQDRINYQALAKKIQAIEARILENHGEN